MHQRIAKVDPSKTLAIMVDKSELQSLYCLKPYSDSEHFCKDLVLEKKQWIYYKGDRRMLVLLHDSSKNKTEKDTHK